MFQINPRRCGLQQGSKAVSDTEHERAVERILGAGDICRSKKNPRSKLPFGKSCLYEMIRRGEFPAPVQISAGRVGWAESTVDSWIKTRPPVADLRRHAA